MDWWILILQINWSLDYPSAQGAPQPIVFLQYCFAYASISKESCCCHTSSTQTDDIDTEFGRWPFVFVVSGSNIAAAYTVSIYEFDYYLHIIGSYLNLWHRFSEHADSLHHLCSLKSRLSSIRSCNDNVCQVRMMALRRTSTSKRIEKRKLDVCPVFQL